MFPADVVMSIFEHKRSDWSVFGCPCNKLTSWGVACIFLFSPLNHYISQKSRFLLPKLNVACTIVIFQCSLKWFCLEGDQHRPRHSLRQKIATNRINTNMARLVFMAPDNRKITHCLYINKAVLTLVYIKRLLMKLSFLEHQFHTTITLTHKKESKAACYEYMSWPRSSD